MNKYEIMVVLTGKMDGPAAEKASAELVKTLGSVADLKEQYLGLKDLAYVIKSNDKGHYFQYNFEASGSNVAEFKRLAVINPLVLRQLVINLEKDYAYRATANADKVAKNEQKKIKHAEFVKRREEEIKNNPELAARYAQRDRRSGGYRKFGPRPPYGSGGPSTDGSKG